MSCWARAGHQVIVVEGWDEPHDEGTFFVVTNPNNPDGRQIDRNRLIDIARSRGCYLVVDEAFADLAPDISVVDLVQELPVIVLRSFGKFFGHAGVRLGVMVAAPDLCSRMRDRLGPWCVSGPALAIASKGLFRQAVDCKHSSSTQSGGSTTGSVTGGTWSRLDRRNRLVQARRTSQSQCNLRGSGRPRNFSSALRRSSQLAKVWPAL